MKLAKLILLSATVLAGSAAQAQVVLPTTDLHGLGATSIQNIVPEELNAFGTVNPEGVNNGTTRVAPVGGYNGVPTFNAATQQLQPNVQGKYIGTGSGGGREGWKLFNRSSKVPTGSNPFDLAGTDATWDHYQFAFSDGVISQSDLNGYVATQAAQKTANNDIGNPIQVPAYLLPVALAYNPVYGHNTATGVDYKFAVKSTFVTANGGLRLKLADYCGIFNGTITNWNDAKLTLSNGGQSLRDPADSLTRWNADGVPIRLVGRSDSSGTTDIIVRHLAAACGADIDAGGTNKYQAHAQSLPYDGTKNLVTVDSKTSYKGAWSAGNFGNTTNDANHNTIGGAVFINGAIDVSQGVEAAGRFLVANGTPALAAAINLAPDHASATDVNTLLNGKIGYAASDFVVPAPGATLFSANLQQAGFQNAASAVFLAPIAKNAVTTLTQLPPQSTATTGAYDTADARMVPNALATGGTEKVDRANPLHWTAVLYSDSTNTLATPKVGYPITGTTQLLTYTCFATKANRLALSDFLGLVIGKAPTQAIPINIGIFASASPTAPGLTAQSGISPLPASWNGAIVETFLKKSTQASNGYTLGKLSVAYDPTLKSYYTTGGTTGNGLQISSAVSATTASLTTNLGNAGCTANQGS